MEPQKDTKGTFHRLPLNWAIQRGITTIWHKGFKIGFESRMSLGGLLTTCSTRGFSASSGFLVIFAVTQICLNIPLKGFPLKTEPLPFSGIPKKNTCLPWVLFSVRRPWAGGSSRSAAAGRSRCKCSGASPPQRVGGWDLRCLGCPKLNLGWPFQGSGVRGLCGG